MFFFIINLSHSLYSSSLKTHVFCSAEGFPDLECECEASWCAPSGFRLCAAGLCKEESHKVTSPVPYNLSLQSVPWRPPKHLPSLEWLNQAAPFTALWLLTMSVPEMAASWSSWVSSIHCPTNSKGEKLVDFNLDRIQHWIGCGAHLSKPVEKLLGLSVFYHLHLKMITKAERLWRKRAREVLLTENSIGAWRNRSKQTSVHML